MTFDAYELSARQGRPVELLEFTDGTDTWRYAVRDQDYTWNGQTWTAETIQRGRIQQSGKLDQERLELRFPSGNTMARRFLDGLGEAVTSVTVRRGHDGDPAAEFVVAWKGRVLGAAISGDVITLTCESIFTAMRRHGLRRRWQRTCSHALYGRGCNLNQADFAEGPFAVGAVSQTAVTVPGAAAQPDGYYSGGLIDAEGASRFILRHTGGQLVLSRAHDAMAAAVAQAGYGLNYGNYYGGVPATLYPGCDRTLQTCEQRFANNANFGGWPWIPKKNPMGGSSIV